MKKFASALWAELLKMRRSRVPMLTTLGFTLAPLMSGMFMFILKDPQRARDMGMLGTKAQLAATNVDWTVFFGMLTQAVAVGGLILFSMVTSWVFGREFSEKTAKELLAIPIRREVIVLAKLTAIGLWGNLTVLWLFIAGLMIGGAVEIPGFSIQLAAKTFFNIFAIAEMTLTLMLPTAYIASIGRSYLPPMGWAVLTIFLSQIIAALGYGDVFPWSVPAIFSGMAGPNAPQTGLHSYIMLLLTGILGLIFTLLWWRSADQTK